MDSITLLTVCALAAAPQTDCPSSPSVHVPVSRALAHWEPLIEGASKRFDIPTAWIRAVMRRESGGFAYLDRQPITSSAGAMGLMQIMPATYAELRSRYGFGPNPYDPRDNIFAGTAYLAELYLRYGYPDLFIAFNAGPARLESYLAGQKHLPDETQTYLARLFGEASIVSPNVAKNALFFVRETTEQPTSPRDSDMPNASALFVTLSATTP